MKPRILVALLLVPAVLSAQAGAPPENDSIRKDDLRADLFFYASDAMGGRLTATQENRIASEFIKSRFERLGLAPAVNGSFFQNFNLTYATLGETNEVEIAAGAGPVLRPLPQQDFITQRFSGSATASGPVTFAGFGISWPEIMHEDFPGDAVRGKIALILTHEPGEHDPRSPFNGVVTSERSVAWRKALSAQQHGAVGVIFVEDVHNHDESSFEALARTTWPDNPAPRARSYTLESWVSQITIPAVQISRATAANLLRSSGRTLDALSRAAEAAAFRPLDLPGATVTMTTTVRRSVVPSRNVVAMVEGSDPALRGEAVVIGAHLDHEGTDGNDIYRGADDNGSGTVALLEIAEAYARAAQAGQRPRRTVIFGAWNNEERGLLGAWAYTEAPVVPLERTVAMINLDMVGRNEEIPVNGGPRFFGLPPQPASANVNSVNLMGPQFAPGLATTVDRVNGRYGLTLKTPYENNESNLVRRSDHWPFLHRGVPAIAFFTGLHPDYHTPTDTPDKINYDKLETIARLVHAVSWTLANQDGAPAR
jgi:Zn-dependent M28 family amino/carboxypeptidase